DYDSGTMPVYELPTGVPDEQRQQIRDHRPDELRDRLVRGPARRNEERGDEAPGNERADVWDHHCGQVAAEALNSFLHRFHPLYCETGGIIEAGGARHKCQSFGRRRFRSRDPARYIVRKLTSSCGTTASPSGCRVATISLATR